MALITLQREAKIRLIEHQLRQIQTSKKEHRAVAFVNTVGQSLHYERFDVFPIDMSAFSAHMLECIAKMSYSQSFLPHSSHHVIFHLQTILMHTEQPF